METLIILAKIVAIYAVIMLITFNALHNLGIMNENWKRINKNINLKNHKK